MKSKSLNLEADFVITFARSIGAIAFSSILVNWENLNFRAIMKNVFICTIGGVALAERNSPDVRLWNLSKIIFDSRLRA